MNQPTIVDDVLGLFRAAGFEVRAPSELDPAGKFAIAGSVDAAGVLMESIIEHFCKTAEVANSCAQRGECESEKIGAAEKPTGDLTDEQIELPPLTGASLWMTHESRFRLANGGNGKGAVPVHCKRSATAVVPLYTADETRNYARAAIAAHLERQAQQAERAPGGTSEQQARYAIDGAIQYGRENRNPPPCADHWLYEYWNIGQQLRRLGETGWDNVTPLAAPVSQEGDHAALEVCPQWISVHDRLPDCDMKAGSLGVEVIVYPRPGKGESTAFFGCRITDDPGFYKYGSLVGGVTHWMHLPPVPSVGASAERSGD